MVNWREALRAQVQYLEVNQFLFKPDLEKDELLTTMKERISFWTFVVAIVGCPVVLFLDKQDNVSTDV